MKLRRTIDMLFDKSDISISYRLLILFRIWFPKKLC